jgi:hypothetical protein
MSFELLFHPIAEEEYIEAYRRYENEQKGLGERFEKFVEKEYKKFLPIRKTMVLAKEGIAKLRLIFFHTQ